MPRFFITQDQVFDDHISIIGNDAHHIARSLRMAIGEKITVCNMQGTEYECEISSFNDDSEVVAKIISQKASENEPKIFITLYQALPKGDKFDTIIQKAVECGVSKIVPFQSERCIVKIKNEAESKKRERRQKISAEAAKQCGRSVIPSVCDPINFEEMIQSAKSSDLILFCYENEGTKPLGKILKEQFETNDYPENISIIIGSEGGFSIKEAEYAKENGAILTGLGKRILRTETASGFVLSCIVCFSEL